MLPSLASLLVAISGIQTHNSADCMGLPSDQQLACIREIRAGRSFDVQYPSEPFPKVGSTSPEPKTENVATQPHSQVQPQQPQPQPALQPAMAADLYQRQLVVAAEKQAAAAERTANATETLATIATLSLIMTLISGIVIAVSF